MIVSDSDLVSLLTTPGGDCSLTPLDVECIGPASVDVKLGTSYSRVIPVGETGIIDPMVASTFTTEQFEAEELLLEPDDFVLYSLLEHFEIGRGYAARVEGRSSIGRLGLLVHVTAGFIDPGFAGSIVLELKNVSKRPVLVTAGMKIAQVVFHTVTTPCVNSYAEVGRYMNQVGAQGSYGV